MGRKTPRYTAQGVVGGGAAGAVLKRVRPKRGGAMVVGLQAVVRARRR